MMRLPHGSYSHTIGKSFKSDWNSPIRKGIGFAQVIEIIEKFRDSSSVPRFFNNFRYLSHHKLTTVPALSRDSLIKSHSYAWGHYFSEFSNNFVFKFFQSAVPLSPFRIFGNKINMLSGDTTGGHWGTLLVFRSVTMRYYYEIPGHYHFFRTGVL